MNAWSACIATIEARWTIQIELSPNRGLEKAKEVARGTQHPMSLPKTAQLLVRRISPCAIRHCPDRSGGWRKSLSALRSLWYRFMLLDSHLLRVAYPFFTFQKIGNGLSSTPLMVSRTAIGWEYSPSGM